MRASRIASYGPGALGACVLAAVVLAGSAWLGSWAVADDRAELLIERAREPGGVVEVRWRDDAGVEQVERLAARADGGAFAVGRNGQIVAGRDGLRWTGARGEVSARDGDDVVEPPAGKAWDLEVSGRERLVGREVTVIVARDADGNVRGRFTLDRESGSLLGREVLDPRGRVVRSVTFVSLKIGAATPPLPIVPREPATAPVPAATLPEEYAAPDIVGRGYHLLGRYRHRDGIMQLHYGDGLFRLSVFEQAGTLDWESLPPGGHDTQLHGAPTRSYENAGGSVAIGEQGGLVFTVVADGPPEAAQEALADLIGGGEDPSWLDDVADFVLGPFGWE